MALLTAENMTIQEEAAGALLNMRLQGDTAVIQAVIDAGGVPWLMQMQTQNLWP